MEQTQNSAPNRRKAKLKERLKFYGFVTMLTAMCAVFILFLFKPDKAPEQERGLDLSIPEASLPEVESDKLKALELSEEQEKQSDRIRILTDFEREPQGFSEDFVRPAHSPVWQSHQTAASLNEQLRTFYDEPQGSVEMAELRLQMENLTRLVEQRSAEPPRPVDEMELLERSFEMASRYMPGGRVSAGTVAPRREVVSACRVEDEIVTSLAGPAVDDDGFITPLGISKPVAVNAIRACVDRNQRVTEGAQVRLRLIDPMQVGEHIIPANTPLYGNAHVDGHRLSVVVTSIESAGNIIPVELSVYDLDGQQGLHVPNSMERAAAKEAMASVGQGVGSGVSFARDARQQVAMDLTRGAMSGVSQYFGTKMREVKIHLKAGYQVLLIAKE